MFLSLKNVKSVLGLGGRITVAVGGREVQVCPTHATESAKDGQEPFKATSESPSVTDHGEVWMFSVWVEGSAAMAQLS